VIETDAADEVTVGPDVLVARDEMKLEPPPPPAVEQPASSAPPPPPP